MSLGKRLLELRKAAGLSQSRLAKQVGVSRNAVSQWEADVTQPSTKNLAHISRALGEPIDEIFAPTPQIRERALEAAVVLFGKNGVGQTTVEAICAAADLTARQFEVYFASIDDLIYEAALRARSRSFLDLRQRPLRYGALPTRLKYLLHHFYVHDLNNTKLVAELHARSWLWDETRERENTRYMLEFHDAIIALMDHAAERGEIEAGNFRAASSAILAIYNHGLRRAMVERADAETVISLIEPQLTMILKGFSLRYVPGFGGDSKD